MPVHFRKRRFLCQKPVLICVRHIASRPSLDPTHASPGIADQKSVCSEQCHLRIVRDQRLSGLRVLVEFRDALVSIFCQNRGLPQKLHRVSERVAHSSAVQAAAYGVQIDLLFSAPLCRIISLVAVLVPVKVREIAVELLEIVLTAGMIHDRKVDPPEQVTFFHPVVVEFLERLIKKIGYNTGVISKSSASKGPEHKVFVSQISRHLQHARDPLIDHRLILRLRHSLHAVPEHRRRAGHHCYDDCIVQKIALFIFNDLDPGMDDHCIGTHISMERPVIFIIRQSVTAFEGHKKRALPAQIFFLRLRAFPHSSSRMYRIGKIQYKDRLRIRFFEVIGKLLCPLPGQGKRILIYAAVPAPPQYVIMLKVL